MLVMIIVFVLVMSVVFGVGALFGYVILQPLIAVARSRKAKFRFYTADFFSLSFVLALPALYVSNFIDSRTPLVAVIVVSGLVFVIAIWAWVRSATKLSSVDVSNSLKRFTFLAILLPIALLGSSMAVPFLLAVSMATLSDPEPRRVAVLIFGFIVVPLTALAGRKVCAWVVRKDGDSTTSDASEQEADLFSTANDELKNGSLPFDD